MRILRQVVGVQSSCFSISLKICLFISFVFSLRASMSSARTPLQSLAIPFFLCCRLQPAPHFWELQNLIYLVLVLLSSPSFVLFISAVIILSIVISLFVVQLAVELSEDVGNSFPRCHRFSFFILRFEDECLFPCGFDLRYVLDSTELLMDLLYRLFPFCSCFRCTLHLLFLLPSSFLALPLLPSSSIL